MGKQTKAKKSDNFGKGKVTPVQVAFLVDRYLSDNSYSQTRSMFRTEASTLISRSPVHETPKSLLTLAEVLDEYISLKGEKVFVDQERVRLEQEKSRIQIMLQGMQCVMNAYNSGGSAAAPPLPAAAAAGVPQLDRFSGSSTGCRVYSTPNVMPMSVPSNQNMEPASFCSPMLNQISTNKRKYTKAPENQQAAKKSRTRKLPVKGANNPSEPIDLGDSQCSLVKASPYIHGTSGSPVQGSNVAKCLFDTSNSPSPRTPTRQVSSQSDKSNTMQEITSTYCTVTSSERLTVSPDKHITYTVERSHCVMTSPAKASLKRPSSKRDNVKGRLDFDGSNEMILGADKQIVDRASTSDTGNDFDLFDMDLPNLDLFGADFSFSELLVDLDLGNEGIDFSCEPTLSTEDISGSSHESGDGNLGADQVMSEFSSTVKVVSEDNNLRGPETTTTMKAITKCIRIVSPTKIQ